MLKRGVRGEEDKEHGGIAGQRVGFWGAWAAAPSRRDQMAEAFDGAGTQESLTFLAVRTQKTGSLFHAIPAQCGRCGRAWRKVTLLSGGAFTEGVMGK